MYVYDILMMTERKRVIECVNIHMNAYHMIAHKLHRCLSYTIFQRVLLSFFFYLTFPLALCDARPSWKMHIHRFYRYISRMCARLLCNQLLVSCTVRRQISYCYRYYNNNSHTSSPSIWFSHWIYLFMRSRVTDVTLNFVCLIFFFF